jgi:RHS repeat-associated protein
LEITIHSKTMLNNTSKIGRALLATLALGLTGSVGFAADAQYYVNDPLATTVAISDAAGEIAAIEADAFGAPLAAGEAPSRYTGKPYDADLGAYVFPFRNYRPEEARWMSADPSGFPDGVNGNVYVGVFANIIDPLGLAGWITIHASNDGGNSSFNTSGHAWVSYRPDGTATSTTYGTWGNNPNNLGNGLHSNLEAGHWGDVSRTAYLDDAAEARLNSTVADYSNRGTEGWTYGGPCSTFATEAWNNATGENLSPGAIISTPTGLKDSIMNKNGGAKHVVYFNGQNIVAE